MPQKVSRRKNSSAGSKRVKPPLAHFVTMPLGNTVMSPSGNIITWQYFLSTLPKSLQLKLAGKRATSAQARSLMREHGIWLITPEKSLLNHAIRDLNLGKSLSFEAQAAIRRSVMPFVRQSLRNIRAAKLKSNSSNEATSTGLSESTIKSILSGIGHSKRYERPWASRSRTKAVAPKTPTTKVTTHWRKQNGIPKQRSTWRPN